MNIHAFRGIRTRNPSKRAAAEINRCYLTFNYSRTWHKVTEADSSHGDETEVEAFEEAPVLPEHEETRASCQV